MLPMRKSKMAKSTRSSNRRPWEHTRYNSEYGFPDYREGKMGKVIGPCHVSCFHHFHPPGFCRKALNYIFITHALLHLVIRVNVSNNVTVVGVRFPLSFSALVVAATPRVSPSFPGNVFFAEVDVDSLNHLGARSLGGRNAAKLPSSMSGLPQMA